MGSDKPDSLRLWRIYHNLYSIFQFNDKIGLIAGFDIGTEQKSKGSSDVNTWYAPVVILRFTPYTHWAFAARGEYYSDKNGVIIYTGTPNGFKTTGLSINIDYLPQNNIALRLEGRTLIGKDDTFIKANSVSNNNTAITFSTAVSF